MQRNACCFTGHRVIAKADRDPLRSALSAEIRALYARGVTRYYAGGVRADSIRLRPRRCWKRAKRCRYRYICCCLAGISAGGGRRLTGCVTRRSSAAPIPSGTLRRRIRRIACAGATTRLSMPRDIAYAICSGHRGGRRTRCAGRARQGWRSSTSSRWTCNARTPGTRTPKRPACNGTRNRKTRRKEKRRAGGTSPS